MKILHIAQERDAALVAAPIVHGIAQNVTLTWVETPAAALEWLQGNPDAAAVIVEVQAQSCASFVEQVRGAGLTTPVVVVAGSARLEPALAVLNSGADGYLVAGPSLEDDLPRTLAAAIERERSRQQRLTQALADSEAQHSVALARETRICMALQQRLLELETAVRKADERRAAEAVSFADQLAKRHSEFTASLTQAAQSRDAVAAELFVVAAALDEVRQARKADAVAAAEHLRRREAELRADLAAAIAARTVLDNALAEAEVAHQDTRQRAAIDLAAANERQAALEDLLSQEADRRTSLDRKLSDLEATQEETEQRHGAELTRAAAEIAELQDRFDAVLEESADARAAFERQSGDAAAARIALERALTEAQSAQEHAMRCAAEDLDAAAARQAALEERLTTESAARSALERDLTEARGESARGRTRFLYVLSTYRRRAHDQKARLEALLAGERTTADRELRAKDEELRQIQLEHETLRRLLGTTQDRLLHLHSTVEEERQAHEIARSTIESELQRVSGEYGQIRQSFDVLQSAFQTLEQAAGEHAAERARLEGVVADRDSQLSAQAERHRVAEQAAHDALAELQEKLRLTLDASASEIGRLEQEIEALRRDLEASRTHAEALRGVAERVPDLQTQLERSQNERRRQFERAPYALCRCSESGAIIDANHSFVALLGWRRADELRDKDFVAAAHDNAGDLSWLLERARSTRKTETVETHWQTWEGRRLVVRLQALASATGAIDIVAEDITSVRALEDRLHQAQRMEAVGRLASEVAVTCDGLLTDVARGTQEWLARAGSDHELRRHAERLLTDVTRAASHLRQLGAYGKEQARALEPVSVRRVLRDLAPVLQRLVGDQIELVLPKASGAFHVDVEAERLQRVLVNVAGYARERMPSGGQIRIDLATTAVGRRFVARYSNVRPGDHVLITVTELPAVGDYRGPSEWRSPSAGSPGVDLSVLAGLIASCGGHLWLEAQPAGTMMLKIHLPKPPAAEVPSTRGGRLSRWFRSTSPVRARA